MKIAVIGATGMLGNHVARAVVTRGHALRVVHRASSKLDKLKPLEFESRIADLDDAAALAQALGGADAVINAAAYYPTVPRAWQEDVRLARAQMQTFLQAAKAASVARVVYLGGAIALRRNPSGEPGNELLEYASEPEDKNNYLQAKWTMDQMALDAARAGQHVVIGIPTMTFGEHDDGVTTGRIVLEIANGKLPGYLRGKRNVVYAGDAAKGLVLCAEKGASGQRYLITGENVSMDDLVALIARKAGKPVPRAIPLRIAAFAAKLGGLKYRLLGGEPPKLSESAVAVMASGQFIDGAKAKRELGYAPTLSLEQTIERSLAWFKSQGRIS
jgi:dihydroflavonol-4-reductase